jgi:hypothetical protein
MIASLACATRWFPFRRPDFILLSLAADRYRPVLELIW